MDPAVFSASQLFRGLSRGLAAAGWQGVGEFALPGGRRADWFGLDGAGNLLIVEIKSSVADFRADGKWPDYLDWCDRFAFCVGEAFPREILPAEPGLWIADAWGAVEFRPAPLRPIAPARRKSLLIALAQAGGRRLQALNDPDFGSGAGL